MYDSLRFDVRKRHDDLKSELENHDVAPFETPPTTLYTHPTPHPHAPSQSCPEKHGTSDWQATLGPPYLDALHVDLKLTR